MDLLEKFQQQRTKQQTNVALTSLTDDERMDFEERAAIMEYDGELPREEAEKQAFELVKK